MFHNEDCETFRRKEKVIVTKSYQQNGYLVVEDEEQMQITEGIRKAPQQSISPSNPVDKLTGDKASKVQKSIMSFMKKKMKVPIL